MRNFRWIVEHLLFEIVVAGLLLLVVCLDFPQPMSRLYCGVLIFLALLRILRKWMRG